MRFSLVSRSGPLLQDSGILILGTSYRLGRSARCAIIVDDVSVSRLHAELLAKPDSVSVKDLGSTNGTFVDAVRIRDAEILPGQIVRFGLIKFELIAREPAAPTKEVDTQVIPLADPAALQPSRQMMIEQLSEAQQRILELLLTGLRESDVAARLDLSHNTVHYHVKKIYRILNVNSRAELLALLRSGLALANS
jgi:DNA-binding CsgD family transcriptional regulator